MKKLYLLSLVSCLLLLQNVAFAQEMHRLMKSPLQMDVKRAQTRSAESSVQLGYCLDEMTAKIGMGSNITVSAAIYITPEQAALYKNDQITSITIGLANSATKFSAFITNDLKGTNLVKQYVGSTSAGWKEVKLKTPYTITGEGFYIGYTCVGEFQIASSDIKSEYGTYIKFGDQEWMDYSDQWGSLCIYAGVEGDNMPNDLSLFGIEDAYSAKVDKGFNLSGVVKSMTTTPVTSYEIKYAIGDGAYVSHKFETALNANMRDTFQIEVPKLKESGEYDLHIAVSKINGNPDDYEGNSAKQSLLRYEEFSFTRKVVVEEGTGLWCGYCPRGIVGMREMKNKYPNTFIGIAAHTGDPLEPDSYSRIFDYFGSYPQCIVNRNNTLILSPTFSNLEEAYLSEMSKIVDAGITLTAEFTSDTQKYIRVNTETVFAASMENAAYSIAFVVIENGVTGYKQQNAYSGGSNGAMGGFEDLPNPVKIDLDDVARGIFKSYTGTLNSVPTSIVKGETYTYTCDFALPDNIQNKANLEIAALLIKSTTKEIVNADKVELKTLTGVEQVPEKSDISVYTEDGMIKVNGDYDTLQVYTTEGIEVDNSQLDSRVYLVRIVVGNHIYVKKIAL